MKRPIRRYRVTLTRAIYQHAHVYVETADAHEIEELAERDNHEGLTWHEGPSIQDPIATDYILVDNAGAPLPPPDDPTYDPHHI